jgi:ethanolamine utilization protein EutN
VKVCRVVGEVVATVKHPALFGLKLLVVQSVTEKDVPVGKPKLAVDSVDVGPGDRVLVSDEGGAAALVLGSEGPIRTVIVGKVDEMSIPESP